MKHFAGTFRWAQTSYFWRVISCNHLYTFCYCTIFSIFGSLYAIGPGMAFLASLVLPMIQESTRAVKRYVIKCKLKFDFKNYPLLIRLGVADLARTFDCLILQDFYLLYKNLCCRVHISDVFLLRTQKDFVILDNSYSTSQWFENMFFKWYFKFSVIDDITFTLSAIFNLIYFSIVVSF